MFPDAEMGADICVQAQPSLMRPSQHENMKGTQLWRHRNPSFVAVWDAALIGTSLVTWVINDRPQC